MYDSQSQDREVLDMPRRLNIKLRRKPAMTVTRVATGDMRLVYVILANKKLKSPTGRVPNRVHWHDEKWRCQGCTERRVSN